MNTQLSLLDIITYLSAGIVLGGIYFYLLWQTIQILPRVKKQGLFLFVSGALRIFLLVFLSLVLAQENVAYFLLIFAGVLLTRLVLLKHVSPNIKKQIASSEVVHANTKNKKRKRK